MSFRQSPNVGGGFWNLVIASFLQSARKGFGPARFFFFSWDINVHQLHLLWCYVSYIIAQPCVALILCPSDTAGWKMYRKSSKANNEFDTTGKKNLSCTGNFFCILGNHINYWSLTSLTDSCVWVFARLLKMQYNLWFSLSLCLINSETCLFLAGSHTERRRVFIHHPSLARLHRFSPMEMLKI